MSVEKPPATIHSENLDLERVCQIKSALDQRRLGYGDQQSYSMLVTPDSFNVCNQEAASVLSQGVWIYHWLEMTNQLYLAGTTNYRYHWIASLFESNLSPQAIKYQRMLAQRGELPLFARADLTDFWSAVEVQFRIGGWGYMSAISEVMQAVNPEPSLGKNVVDIALDSGFAMAVRAKLGREPHRVVLLCPTNYLGESAYFASLLKQRQGLNCEVVLINDWEEEIRDADFIYRRELNLPMLAESPTGRKLIERNLRGEVAIEPPLNVIFDQKLAMAFPFHPKLKTLFNDHDRALFAPTHILDHLLDLPRWADDEIVYKYAGSLMKLSFGSRQVWRLDPFSNSRWTTIHRCYDDLALSGQPWIIQPYYSPKFPVRYFDQEQESLVEENMHARFMPIYSRNPQTGKICFIGITANFRPHWKVRGASDAVLTDVRIK
ncbi:MAG TPA: hypothetical protein VMW41_03800 [Candidatus Bathyarchaeia archaeon]|nr:hypothetical protein [Candidatus Bathyarchaeia archaeon]